MLTWSALSTWVPMGRQQLPRVLASTAPKPDGMTVDTEGNLYVCVRAGQTNTQAGIQVFSPGGILWGTIDVPEAVVTNCEFGGHDLTTLYITGETTLYSIKLRVRGIP